ncbi:MAG: metallophosphoesterase [Anaerolineales bacterium]|nr:metallophosphoesterase [Anaerolineales bacterium]
MKTLSIHAKVIILIAIISLLSLGASAPRQADRIVFAVIGDYGLAGQPEADVANLVKSWNPDFIVTVGDNNYPNGAAYSIDQNIGQYYHNYIFKYKGKYGGGSDTRRFFPALGNHDWHESSANAHTNYFNLPGNERFYEFTYGSLHFFILDSVKDEPEGNSPTSPQAKWLQKALTASTSQFNIVVTHYAPYSSGEHGSVSFMQWQYKEWGADVVLAGHDHIYERLIVDGLPYFVNGAGGDSLYGFRPALPETQFRYNQNYGAMRVEASGASLKFQFFTRDNILMDEYTLGEILPATPTEFPAPTATITPTDFFTSTPTTVPPTDFPTPTATIAPTEFIAPTATIAPTLFVPPTETSSPARILPPVLFSPPDNATMSAHYKFNWERVYNATRYHIEIDNHADFSSPEWSSWRRDPEYPISSMNRKTTYYWHVRAKDMDGNWSEWSAVFKMSVP